ncbi:MAG TPA: hypothetical protein VH761_00690, partial [Ilumatobacteraceae bacterium]
MSSSADLPFVAAPPGSVDSVTRSAEAAARHWGLAPPALLRMGMNGIFTAGDGVLLRVTRPTAPAEQAIALGHLLRRAGIRVPTYLHDEPFVVGEHSVFAVAAIKDAGPVDWPAVGAMVARLHSLDAASVAAVFPVPFCGDFPWWDFTTLLDDVGGDLDAASRSAIE